MKSRAIQIALAVALLVGVAAAGSITPARSVRAPYVSAALVKAAADSSAISVVSPASLTAALPSVTYLYHERTIRYSSAVATGQFSDPKLVPSALDSEEPESDMALPWQRGNLTFTVRRVISAAGLSKPLAHGDRLTLELYFEPGVDVIRAETELANLREGLVFLAGGNGVSGDESQWSIAGNGALVGSVDESGAVTMLAATRDSTGRSRIDGIDVNISDLNGLTSAALKVNQEPVLVQPS